MTEPSATVCVWGGVGVQVLTGHFSCDPLIWRQQWGEINEVLSDLPPLPLVKLADHDSIMVPGEGSAQIPKEISLTVKARDKEGLVVAHLLDTVWVHVHREFR